MDGGSSKEESQVTGAVVRINGTVVVVGVAVVVVVVVEVVVVVVGSVVVVVDVVDVLVVVVEDVVAGHELSHPHPQHTSLEKVTWPGFVTSNLPLTVALSLIAICKNCINGGASLLGSLKTSLQSPMICCSVQFPRKSMNETEGPGKAKNELQLSWTVFGDAGKS